MSIVLKMRCVVFILTTLVVAILARNYNLKPSESDDIINIVNNANITWKAGHNFNFDLKLSDFKKLLGSKRLQNSTVLPLKTYENLRNGGLVIPDSFDSRLRWAHCSSINEIHDQGACGSCWAVAAVDALTDRFCIATNNSWGKNKHISAENLLSCCGYCGNCDYGYIEQAWYYFKQTGVVSGGYYNSREGCQPYSMQPCEHTRTGSRINCADIRPVATPFCKKNCFTDDVHYENDIHYVSEAYRLNYVRDMQMDMMNFGPITAVFGVYEDFPNYKSGVYQHFTGSKIGNLAVRIIGWGSEGGVPYWTVANSFNTDWGDKGCFKIRRGNNECGIENYVFAGIPYVSM